MQAPGKLDLDVYQGATFSYVLTWKVDDVAVNLTSYTARLQARTTPAATATALSMTTSGGGITLGGAAGTITLARTATQTAALTPGRYVYDLELESAGGVVTRLIEGELIVHAEVTR